MGPKLSRRHVLQGMLALVATPGLPVSLPARITVPNLILRSPTGRLCWFHIGLARNHPFSKELLEDTFLLMKREPGEWTVESWVEDEAAPRLYEFLRNIWINKTFWLDLPPRLFSSIVRTAGSTTYPTPELWSKWRTPLRTPSTRRGTEDGTRKTSLPTTPTEDSIRPRMGGWEPAFLAPRGPEVGWRGGSVAGYLPAVKG